jgi:hypothetical protein
MHVAVRMMRMGGPCGIIPHGRRGGCCIASEIAASCRQMLHRGPWCCCTIGAHSIDLMVQTLP